MTPHLYLYAVADTMDRWHSRFGRTGVPVAQQRSQLMFETIRYQPRWSSDDDEETYSWVDHPPL